MSTHTPGPWFLGCDGPFENDYYVEARDCFVVQGPLTEPNARLIAAAPDMLAVLQDLMHLWHGPGFHVTSNEVMDAMERARAAIAKATGAPE